MPWRSSASQFTAAAGAAGFTSRTGAFAESETRRTFGDAAARRPLAHWAGTAPSKARDDAVQTVVASPFSRLPVFRGARYLAYDVLGLRNVVEGLLERRPVGDTTVVLSVKA